MPDVNALIERWRAGEQSAGEALYNAHREPVLHLAYALLGDPTEAEEIAQDVLAYALKHTERYDPALSRFTTWLHMITVSRCRDRHRRRQFPVLSLFTWLHEDGDIRDPTPGPEAYAIRLEARSQVWEAVQALSHPLREAILLRYWANYTYSEMAQILGCPVSTAQSRVRLAYERLRVTIAPTIVADYESEQAQ